MKRLLPLVLSALVLPGCVVWDIRNEMRGTNAKLTDVKATLDKANEGLAKANGRLDQVEDGLKRLDKTNDLIGGVEQGMARIDRTNSSLETLQKQLDLLAAIEKSLARLDTHLTAVRKTIGSIDSMIPFLDLGGGAVEDPPPPSPAPAAAPTGAPPPAEKVEDTTQATRRDAIAGIWVGRYPDDATALLLLPDGRYIRSTLTGGKAESEVGRWQRETTPAATLTLTPDTPAPAAAPGGTPPADPPKPKPARFTVLQSTTRGIALQAEDGRVMIFGRP